jgi:cellulose synthase operon protein C
VEQGDLKRGMQLLSEAVKAAPDVPDLRLHYAQALLKSGDKAGARRELEQAVQAQADSPAKAEAEALLKQL